MNRVVLASLGMIATAAMMGSAGAADLQRRNPPPYSPPPQAVPYYSPVYNWSGLYVGINGGGAWGTSNWDSLGSFNVKGGMIGGTVGYNWQGGPWVLGVEGDLDWSGIDGTRTSVLCPLGCKTANSWIGTVRGRVGYSFDRIMPYLTGGLAFGNVKASSPGFPGSTETNVGWTAGAGLEVALMGRWTAKAEYLYVNLGDNKCDLNCGFQAPDNVNFRTHMLRGGLNYRF